MGTWGKGNFENDTAADFLSIYTSELISEIQEIIDQPREIEPDEYEGVALPCKIEILTILTKQGWAGCMHPGEKTVELWKKKYLSVYDGYVKSETYSEFNKERRKLIQHTFDEYVLSISKYT